MQAARWAGWVRDRALGTAVAGISGCSAPEAHAQLEAALGRPLEEVERGDLEGDGIYVLLRPSAARCEWVRAGSARPHPRASEFVAALGEGQ